MKPKSLVGQTKGRDWVTAASGAESSPVKPPKVLMTVELAAKQRLLELLRETFEHIDDAVYQMADRAGSNQEQNHYLEQMREFRLQRKGVLNAFAQGLQRGFHQLPDPDADIHQGADIDELSTDGLSLVQHDELELDIAIDTMVTKYRTEHNVQLDPLTLRLDTLLMHVSVTPSTNPLDPKQLGSYLRDCLEVPKVDVKLKLIFLKCVDKYLMAHLDLVYERANASLIEAGVLPEISRQDYLAAQANYTARSSGSSGRSEPQNNTLAAPGSLVAPEASHQNAPASAQASQGGVAAPPWHSEPLMPGHEFNPSQSQGRWSPESSAFMGSGSGGQGAAGYEDPFLSDMHDLMGTQPLQGFEGLHTQQALTPAQLTSAIDRVQRDPLMRKRYVAQVNDREGLTTFLGGAIANVMGTAASVSARDQDIIQLVSMLFEFILEDRSLPMALRAVLARLQIPYLKVAIIDPAFFSRSDHPARQLLNEMARCGMGLTDAESAERDHVFRKIHATVQVILNDFDRDLQLFGTLLNDFKAFVDKERKRAQIIEQRLKHAEQGRVKSELSRLAASNAIEAAREGRLLPDALDKLIKDAWQPLMFLIHLKEGEDSEAWATHLRIISEVIRSVRPASSRHQQHIWLKKLPKLMDEFKEGVTRGSNNAFEAMQWMDELDEVHAQVVRGEVPEYLRHAGSNSSDPADQLVAAVSKDIAASEQAFTGNTQRLEATVSTRETASPSTPLLEDDDPALTVVDNIRVSTWVEIVRDENTFFRAKLAAKISASDKFIFVNRSGIKVAEKNRQELALMIKRREMRLLDDVMLFDRALESVIGNLRRGHDANQG